MHVAQLAEGMHAQSPGFKPQHFINQACWRRPAIPETRGSEIQDWVGRWLRSPHCERRDQPLHVVLTSNVAVVCTNPHTKLIRVAQKNEIRLVNGTLQEMQMDKTVYHFTIGTTHTQFML